MITVAAIATWISGASVAELVGGAVTASASIFGAFKGSVWIAEHRSKRVHVLRAKSIDDRSFRLFHALYEKLIDVSIRVEIEQIERAIKDQKSSEIKHSLLYCVSKGELLGFCQVFYSASKKLAFISYLGIDSQKNTTEVDASLALCTKVGKLLKRELGKNYVVLFEVDCPRAPSIPPEEAARRRAKIKRFKRLGKTKRSGTFEIDFQYVQPEVPNENPLTNEHAMRLLAVVQKSISDQKGIHRDELATWLRFAARVKIVVA